MVSNLKIGIAIGALAVAAFTLTEEQEQQASNQTTMRVPQLVTEKSPPCLQMYYYIKAYADTFDIPLRYAFGIANTETSYNGPLDWNYNPALTSSAGAVGPMQVMVSTARWINKDNVTKEELKTNIKYNVYTSMKLLRKLFNRNGDWKLAFGEYNTGRPCVNGYAHKVYNYVPNW